MGEVSRARSYQVSAIVLRQRDLGEADRIVVLLTRERGKLSAVAKGVKRARSKLAPALQLFTHARLQLASGRSLEVVTQAQAVAAFPRLRSDVERYACASYTAELADAMIEEGASCEWVFDLVESTLAALDDGGEMASLVRGFELKLLTGLGYGPELERCVECGVEVGDRAGGFSAVEGGVICPRCARGGAPISEAALAGLRGLLRLPQPDLGGKKLKESVRQELERLMRRFVDYRVERELRSAAFLPK